MAFGGSRDTQDVDVIAPIPLTMQLKEKVKEVAEQLGEDPNWLNDSCKGFADYFAPDWEKRLIPINLGFKKLKIHSLGKPELILLKLKASRAKDIEDVKTIGISKEDIPIILEGIKKPLDSIKRSLYA